MAIILLEPQVNIRDGSKTIRSVTDAASVSRSTLVFPGFWIKNRLTMLFQALDDLQGEQGTKFALKQPSMDNTICIHVC